MHRFFALPESIRDERILLDREETRHLRDVLRLVEGTNLLVFDGCGSEYYCTIVEIKKTETELLIISKQDASSPESKLELTLAAAMLKGEKFDLVVQKAVELGVRRLVALRTARTDVRSKGSEARVQRWRKIALEASKQSGRAFLMSIEGPVDLIDYLQSIAARETILFSEREGESLPTEIPAEKMTAIVGPEGGWDDIELENAKAAGVRIVTLGGRITRAETAAIAATAILQHRYGDLK